MTAAVRRAVVYTILNSGGGRAAEAEVTLADGTVGCGSAPVAIKPGAREARRSSGLAVGEPVPAAIASEVAGLARTGATDQAGVDGWLADRVDRLGADVTLAVSLAYARAAARSAGVPLVRHFATLAGTHPAFPGLLAAAVSGGIHGGSGLPFQQIMLATAAGPPSRTVPAVMAVYRRVEQALFDAGQASGYSASSGVVPDVDGAAAVFDVVTRAIADAGVDRDIGIAIDVAAEHLHEDGGYRLGGRLVKAADLARWITELTDRYPVVMVEDPFVASDRDAWVRLNGKLRERVTVLGDDLFATNSRYLDPALAGGVLLKLNQVGTLTATVYTAVRARESGMAYAVSHRSLETEDTAVCDLAVALGANWIKVGGPRRGDRVTKYNQLLRLERDTAAWAQ
ncbi:hypothetical protein F6X68_09895 [Micromonospora sp. AMSO12t]|nr:hypothetical protein F6X68_09895 [Micromonospora sp. AMSO12t]